MIYLRQLNEMQENMKTTYLIIFILFLASCGTATRQNKSYMDIAYQKAQEGNYRLALKYYDKAIDAEPQNADAYYHRGNIKYDLKDYKGAINDCGKALNIDPQLTDAYFNIGISKYHLEKYQEAIIDFDKAITANDQDAESYCWRGNTHHKLKNNTKACKDWNKAKDLGNSYVNEYLNKYCGEEGKTDTGGGE